MSINDSDQSIKPQEVQEQKSVNDCQVLSPPVHEDIIKREVGKMLGIENDSDFDKYGDKLKFIAEYVKNSGKTEIQDIKWAVRQFEMRLATPALGENRVNNLHRYIYLLNESKNIEKELDHLGGKNGSI